MPPRRPLLLALLTLLAAAPPAASGQRSSEWVHQDRLDVDAPWGRTPVLVTYPRRRSRGRLPTVIALPGQGESGDMRRGHLAYAIPYRLPDAFGAFGRGRLFAADFRSLVREAHLDAVNAGLRARPFRGVLVITPAVPELSRRALGDADVEALGAWLAGPLLEAVRAEHPKAARTRGSTGIDGISLGGRVALEVGFRHPDAFGAVGGIQPAVGGLEADLAELARDAARRAPQRLRLLTSDDDPLRPPTVRLSEALLERRVPHRRVVVPGPHDYVFNRGPGCLELLRFAHEALPPEELEAP